MSHEGKGSLMKVLGDWVRRHPNRPAEAKADFFERPRACDPRTAATTCGHSADGGIAEVFELSQNDHYLTDPGSSSWSR